MKKVLIAHQSTIPFYRVPFFNALEARRPDQWDFKVVDDFNEKVFLPGIKRDISSYQFKTLEVSTRILSISGKSVTYQKFWKQAADFDLIIVEHALNNLMYPLCQLHQVFGKKFAFWGHGRDRNASQPSIPKRLAEKFKIFQAGLANGFFAYTDGVKQYLMNHGLSENKIYVVNNTIDILEQRQNFGKWLPERESRRDAMGLSGKKVLLFVGRPRSDKRIDFLLESFAILREIDPAYHLILVGSGSEAFQSQATKGVTFFGPLVDLDQLGPIYVVSDVYVIAAAVGLGPLQALCYDLPIVTIHADNHGPEFEYLSNDNSLILPREANAQRFAQAIHHLLSDSQQLLALKSKTWSSVQHLTIENMADRFIEGINQILLR